MVNAYIYNIFWYLLELDWEYKFLYLPHAAIIFLAGTFVPSTLLLLHKCKGTNSFLCQLPWHWFSVCFSRYLIMTQGIGWSAFIPSPRALIQEKIISLRRYSIICFLCRYRHIRSNERFPLQKRSQVQMLSESTYCSLIR